MLSPDFFCVNPIDLNRAYPDGVAMSVMRYANTKILIVTCYLLLTRFCYACSPEAVLLLRHASTYFCE